MNDRTRRVILQQMGVATAAVIGAAARPRRAVAADQKAVVGFIGCGGMGTNHLKMLAQRKDATLTYICDPDAQRLAAAAKAVEQTGGGSPKMVKDLRRVLDDKAVDAVWIATPDHWHGPAAILAAQAGKHVYVEKPCSHNIREGRLMVQAARRYKRIIQVGTQSRSSKNLADAVQSLREGLIGKVLVAKAVNSQKRAHIGRAQPSQPPPQLDYDLWLGPAPLTPYQPNLLHYNWHWFYNFGTGDMGNDGVHELDIARWGLGVETHPTLATGYGSKLHFDDDQQFPDTQYVSFEYPTTAADGKKKLLVYEQRLWSPHHQEGFENGNIFYGTDGFMLLSKSQGWKAFKGNRLVKESPGGVSLTDHHSHFLDAIRSGTAPNADIEIGHLSATLVHLGNIVARTGRAFRFDPASEHISSDTEADTLTHREYRDNHWAVPAGV